MNVDRLTQIAEWLEAGAPHKYIKFNMATGITLTEIKGVKPNDIMTCKTSCCIAGYAVMRFNEPQTLMENVLDYRWTHGSEENPDEVPLNWREIAEKAEALLGIDTTIARELFTPNEYCKPYRTLHEYTNPAWAARVIRNLIATGGVDWEGCRNG